MKLTVHEAAVHTATVEIRTLTISGKQVTLAVFRQLEREAILNGNAELLGLPWGWVNYHSTKCRDAGDHLHVVWQKGSTLRHAMVYKDSWHHRRRFSHMDSPAVERRYQERWEELTQLPQLFIAV